MAISGVAQAIQPPPGARRPKKLFRLALARPAPDSTMAIARINRRQIKDPPPAHQRRARKVLVDPVYPVPPAVRQRRPFHHGQASLVDLKDLFFNLIKGLRSVPQVLDLPR